MVTGESKSSHPFEYLRPHSSVCTGKAPEGSKPGRILLLSIRPRFGGLILQGEKTAELRRIRPRVKRGQWALIYLSSPRKALGGAFQIDDVKEDEPTRLWSRLGTRTGIEKHVFEEYFEGARTAYALIVGKVIRLEPDYSLNSIRTICPDFHPPQLYSYLESDHPLISVIWGADGLQKANIGP